VSLDEAAFAEAVQTAAEAWADRGLGAGVRVGRAAATAAVAAAWPVIERAVLAEAAAKLRELANAQRLNSVTGVARLTAFDSAARIIEATP